MQNTHDETSQTQTPSESLEQTPVTEVVSNEHAILRHAREGKRLSVGDVAYSLKVSPRVIEALEASEWDKLPGRTFIVGILRAYGRLLEVPVDGLVATVPGASSAIKKSVPTTSSAAKTKSPTAKPSAPKTHQDRETKRQSNRMLKFGLIMVLIAIALAYAVPRETLENALEEAQSQVQRLMSGKAQEPAAPAEQAQPVAGEQSSAAPAADQQAQTGTGTLELRFAAPAWVEVRDHSGRIIYSQLNAAGATQFITGTAPLDVMIGNAKQVQARWRDEPLKLDKLSGDDVARQTLR